LHVGQIANRYGYSKHKPALPLFTVGDAEAALRLIQPRPYGQLFPVTPGFAAVFRHAGHILGSATIELQIGETNPTRLVYSGDLGRWNRPILRNPEFVSEADTLLVESTYGDRIHGGAPEEELAQIVREAVQRGGALLVPAFAVDRTQELIWYLRRLEEANRIPSVPVYIDSPMAIDVTEIYSRHPEEHDLDMALLVKEHQSPLRCRQQHFTRTPEESKAINHVQGPIIIISASGMATGGRVLHHLKLRLPDPRTTVLLVGFQAAGTRGRSLQQGATTIRMHGQNIPVRARVETLDGLSAHADREEIFRWLSGFRRAPSQTYIVHGEPGPAQSLAETVQTRLHWNAAVARDGETVQLL
jgi:metallo-beta-lactamase family protein